MKTNYLLLFLLLGTLLNGNSLIAQSTEDFETDTFGATTFSDNGQNFTITNGPGETTYRIFSFTNAGWNGTSTDNQFIDNSGGNPPQNDGSSFTVSTTNGAAITIKSLYLFVSPRNLSQGVSTIITITGKRDGANIYTIVKSSGIVDGGSFTPNNGFTFIDFSSEGGIDNSDKNVDEIILSTTGNADYLALDAFTWGAEVLSTNNFEVEQNKVKLFPNPSTDFIQISGTNQTMDYSVSDILGKNIQNGSITNEDKIDIQSLSKGVYFLKLDNGNTIKFIKE